MPLMRWVTLDTLRCTAAAGLFGRQIYHGINSRLKAKWKCFILDTDETQLKPEWFDSTFMYISGFSDVFCHEFPFQFHSKARRHHRYQYLAHRSQCVCIHWLGWVILLRFDLKRGRPWVSILKYWYTQHCEADVVRFVQKCAQPFADMTSGETRGFSLETS